MDGRLAGLTYEAELTTAFEIIILVVPNSINREPALAFLISPILSLDCVGGETCHVFMVVTCQQSPSGAPRNKLLLLIRHATSRSH
jgi:hypothetical protein